MSLTDDRRRTGKKHLLIAAIVVLVVVTITQYAGMKGAVREFNDGFRDGLSRR